MLEHFQLICSLIAIVISIVAIFLSVRASRKAGKIAEQGNNIQREMANLQNASVELEMRGMIEEARRQVGALVVANSELITKDDSLLRDDEKKQKRLLRQTIETAIQGHINSCEEACMKYLDGKVDKVRFKKTFQVEIRQMVENEEHRRFFDPVTSHYKAILKVYEEWENPER